MKFKKNVMTSLIALTAVTLVGALHTQRAHAIVTMGVLNPCPTPDEIDNGLHKDFVHQAATVGDMAGCVAFAPLCAPEVAEGNLAATDRIMQTLAASPRLSNADRFKFEIGRIQGLSPTARLTEYFKAVGVNSKDEAEIVAFLGQRTPDQKYRSALVKNMSLSDSQATEVINSLTSALVGVRK